MDFDATTFRVFLHVLSASVWVGGQIVLAALVPTVRTLGADAPRKVAQAFNRVAWPFFGLAVATGIWNLMEVDIENSSNSYQVGVMLKLLIVAVSGVSAYLHTAANSRRALAVWGATGAAAALAAMLFGASLATSF
jgi:putative copper export protein